MSPPSIARSAAGDDPLGTSAKRAGAGSPLRLAEVWKIGHIAPASGPPIRRTPSRSRILATGERVAMLGVGDDEGDRARQQGADRRPRARAEALDQLAHRQRREVDDGRGLAVVAPLDPVDARDRLGVERVAGEPIEPVGGEDGDAALAMQASSAARACSAPARSIEIVSFTAAPITIRSIPARSARVSTPPKPASRSSAANRACLSLAYLQRHRLPRR